MEKTVRIYDLHDPQQYEDERMFWRNRTFEEKLHTLESIRNTWYKLNKRQRGDQQRLRRVLRIIEPE